MSHVSLSVSTITRATDETAEHIGIQLLENINELPCYAVQVDKFTGVDHTAAMLVFV